MSPSVRRQFQAILAGLVVLALTAGAAFAGQPDETPVDGRAIASERSGHSVPLGPGGSTVDDEDEDESQPDEELDEEPDEEPDEELDEETTEDETADADVEADEEGSHCVDPTTLTVEELALLNHGAIVCWAAHQVEPDGYRNHGQWVSEWARGEGEIELGEGDTALDEGATELAGLKALKVKGKVKGKGKGKGRAR